MAINDFNNGLILMGLSLQGTIFSGYMEMT